MSIDDYIAEKDKILGTHDWGEAYFITSKFNGKPHMKHRVQQCLDCFEYKSYNRSDIKPCAKKPHWQLAAQAA